jgi:DNA-binding MarR family transcriptional regulator
MKMVCNAEPPQPVSLIEISRVLEETARLVRRHAGATREGDERPGASISDVRAVIAVRRLRRRYLGVEATDAAWSMMLELYVARLEGRTLHLTGLSAAAGVAETTAYRVTHKMLEAGVFVSGPHPNDKRLLVIGLSTATAERIRAYLAATLKLAGIAA